METITTLLSNYAFPIVCCLALGWYIYKTTASHRDEIATLNAEHRKEIAELNTQHKQETDKMTEALNNNTLVLQKVSDKLDIILKGGSNDV